MTTENDAKLTAIHKAIHEPRTLCRLLRDYYNDKSVMDTVPRELMFLHLGMVCGVLERIMESHGKIIELQVRHDMMRLAQPRKGQPTDTDTYIPSDKDEAL
jgi:hypothetical protein